jgi:uncharacterized OB-fold protein
MIGTPLSSEDFARGRVIAVPYAPRAEYAWDTGQAMGHYLAMLREGRLVGRECLGCARVMIPPRMFCERCFRRTDRWVDLKDTGTVNTFSLCTITWDMKKLRRPEMPAVIEIDGASPGHGILHKLGRVAPKRVKIGMRVRAVWKPPARREGKITDILYWVPR